MHEINEGISIEENRRYWPFWAQHSTIEELGGLMYPSHESDFRRYLCSYALRYLSEASIFYRKEYYAYALENLTLFYLKGDEANAFAFRSEEFKAIGINIGILEQIWLHFYRGVASGKFMEHWLTSQPPFPDGIDLCSVENDPLWDPDKPSILPDDRKEMFFDLFLRTINFLVLHEWAHHARAHLLYFEDKTGVSFIDESLGFSLKKNKNNEILRLLEFDADIHATDFLLEMLHCEMRELEPSYNQSATEFHLLAISIICLFQLFDKEHSSIAGHYRASHPPPVHRAMIIVNRCANSFVENYGWTREQKIDEVDKAWYTGSQLAASNNFPKNRWHGDSVKGMDEKRLLSKIDNYNKFSEKLDLWNEKQNERQKKS